MTGIGDSAIVDDQDASVQYIGSWGRAGVAEEFNSTTSFPQVTGALLSFPFIGTSIQPYATYTGSPTVFMSIDNDAFTATFERPQSASGSDIDPSDPIYHQPLWTDPPSNLADGPHTLFINLTSNPTAGTIFIDYFIYTISAYTTLQDKRIFVDDRDSRIRYGDGWRQFGSDPDFMHTSLGSSTTGNNFTYTFEGTGISMYGGLNNNSADQMVQASMVIDNGSPVIFAPGPQPEAIMNNNQYFSIENLEQGNHTMTVTALNDHTVWVDYFLVIPGNVSLLSSASPISTSAGPSTSASVTASPLAVAASKHSTGAIVGGVVGGVFGLAIILGILFWIRRRKQHSQYRIPTPTQYEPFVSEVSMSHNTASAAISSVAPSRKNATTLRPSTPPLQQNPGHRPIPSSLSTLSDPSVRSTSTVKAQRPPGTPHNTSGGPYVDSGIRFTDPRPPPSYTPV